MSDLEKEAEEWITRNWYYGEAQGADRRDIREAYLFAAKRERERILKAIGDEPYIYTPDLVEIIKGEK